MFSLIFKRSFGKFSLANPHFPFVLEPFLLEKIRTRLEFKILLLLIAVLIVGFGSYVIITIDAESKALLGQHQEILKTSSEMLMAGIRNVMLTGKAPFAAELVNDVRHGLAVDLTIYDRFGREVFLREGEGCGPHCQRPVRSGGCFIPENEVLDDG